MVRQDREDAKHNVEKRIEFITAELIRAEQAVKKSEQEFEAKREKLAEIQAQSQQTVLS